MLIHPLAERLRALAMTAMADTSLQMQLDPAATDLPREDWLKGVASRPSAKSKGDERRDRIVSIDFNGPNAAFAKVECQLPPRYFTDYLTLLKADGRWQVISKSFHTVTKDK